MRTSPLALSSAQRALSLTFTLSFALSVSATRDASARSYRVTQVPNNTWGCAMCHQGPSGGPRNPFGLDVGATLNGADADWSAVCDLDSDGDGYTNGEELGDTDCLWVTGNPNPPGPTYKPYDANDYPMPEPPPVGGEPVGGEPVGGEPVGGEPLGGDPMEPVDPPPPMGGEPMEPVDPPPPMGGEPMEPVDPPPMGGEPMGGEPADPTPDPTGVTPDPYRPTYGPVGEAEEVEGGCESNPGRGGAWGALFALLALMGLRTREEA